MQIPYYQIDAFTDRVFRGNPAGVCLLKEWPDDAFLQAIASENNLSETAFLVPEENGYEIRWFTPAVEVDLCGHATLASAHVILHFVDPERQKVEFYSRHSGKLIVERDKDLLRMDFPAHPPSPCEAPPRLIAGLGKVPLEVWKSDDYLAVFATEADVRAIAPNFSVLKELDLRGIIVTAPGNDCDFVSRFFAPAVGVDEDPVTGSAHTTLVPYWKKILHKRSFFARQVSRRGGELICEDRGDRVIIAGRAACYLRGTLTL